MLVILKIFLSHKSILEPKSQSVRRFPLEGYHAFVIALCLKAKPALHDRCAFRFCLEISLFCQGFFDGVDVQRIHTSLSELVVTRQHNVEIIRFFQQQETTAIVCLSYYFHSSDAAIGLRHCIFRRPHFLSFQSHPNPPSA